MTTVLFTPMAATVLNIGQVPKKTTMPKVDTIAEATVSCRHISPGIRAFQSERATMTKPIKDTIQKILAMMVAVDSVNDGNNQDCAGCQVSVSMPRLWVNNATNTPPWASPCSKEHSGYRNFNGLTGHVSFILLRWTTHNVKVDVSFASLSEHCYRRPV